MRWTHLLCSLLLLATTLPALAETVPITIWQKEKRWQPQQEDTIRLQRGPFFLIAPIQGKEWLEIVSGVGDRPEPMQGFVPGRGLAGPYEGFFLTWQAYHYFDIDKGHGPPRMALWNAKDGLYYWRPTKLYDLSGDTPVELDWQRAPNLTLVLRKKNFEDLTLFVKWVD